VILQRRMILESMAVKRLAVAVSAMLLVVACNGDPLNASSTGGGAGAPQITTPPQSVTVATGQTATFTVSATGTAPLTYQWNRGGNAIAGATLSSYTLTTQSTDTGATFNVVVSNSFGSVESSSATLTVTSM
jgi:hypothetical protein